MKKRSLLSLGAIAFLLICGTAIAANQKVVVCHKTGSASNPYVKIEISTNGLHGHEEHEGDIINPQGGCPMPTTPNQPETPPNQSETPSVPKPETPAPEERDSQEVQGK